jgi:hypothetical protein
MSTQLRLVESPAPKARQRPGARARVTRAPKARRAHWSADWRLDDRTRRAGREGVAAARQALAQARGPEDQLSQAS